MKRLIKKLSWKKEEKNFLPEEELDKLRDYSIYNSLDIDEKDHYDQLLTWYKTKIVSLLSYKDSSFYDEIISHYKKKNYPSLKEMLKQWGFDYQYSHGSRTELRSEKELQEDLKKIFPTMIIPKISDIAESTEDPYIFGQISSLSISSGTKVRDILKKWGFTVLTQELEDLPTEEEILLKLREWYTDGNVVGLSIDAEVDRVKKRVYKSIAFYAKQNKQNIKEYIDSLEWKDGVNFTYDIRSFPTEEEVLLSLRKWYTDGNVVEISVDSVTDKDKKRIYSAIIVYAKKNGQSVKQYIDSLEWKDGVNFTYDKKELPTEEEVLLSLRKWYTDGNVVNLSVDLSKDKEKSRIYWAIKVYAKQNGKNIKQYIDSLEWKDGVNFTYDKKELPTEEEVLLSLRKWYTDGKVVGLSVDAVKDKYKKRIYKAIREFAKKNGESVKQYIDKLEWKDGVTFTYGKQIKSRLVKRKDSFFKNKNLFRY